jgi:anti-sigma factor RsiW
MTTTEENAEFEHVESLLPWYASGTLAPEDIRRVEKALAEAPELLRRYYVASQERSAVVDLNENLGAPSPRAIEKLFARLESAAAKTPKRRNFVFGNWLAERFSAWQPRSLAFAGMAASLVALIEAGLLATTFFTPPQTGATDETASVSRPASRSISKEAAEQGGAYLLIAFAPDATAAQILRFLEAHNASIIDGPVEGGIFRVRVSDKALTTKDLGAIVASMRNESTIVRFVAPTT